jgi:GTP-binding protein
VVDVAGSSFVMADIPGLIEGAHEGAGLGTRFLGHIERCAVLFHLVDASGEDPAAAYRTVRRELKAYGAGLETKPELVALNKADLLGPEAMTETVANFHRRVRKTPLVLSGATGQGVREAMAKLLTDVDRQRRQRAAEEGRADQSGSDEWHP